MFDKAFSNPNVIFSCYSTNPSPHQAYLLVFPDNGFFLIQIVLCQSIKLVDLPFFFLGVSRLTRTNFLVA
ncbi:hypothetical protein Hdeb2414_s0027g00696931 [Helianthus debilis subsp. tardiflorus]